MKWTNSVYATCGKVETNAEMLQQWPLDICRIQYLYRNNHRVMLTSNQITPQIQYLYEPERYANLKLLHMRYIGVMD